MEVGKSCARAFEMMVTEPCETSCEQRPESAISTDENGAQDTDVHAMRPSSASDPRIARTRAAIREAFTNMVCEDDPSKITVKALTDRAGINRKTFYLHYESIEALFEEVANEVMDSFFLQHETTPDIPEDIDGHAQRFFLFLAGQPMLTERLICSPVYYYDFGERIYRAQMSRYRTVGDPFGWMTHDKEELVLSFIRATALNFYRQWVKQGKVVPAKEAAQLLGELTHHGVAGLMK